MNYIQAVDDLAALECNGVISDIKDSNKYKDNGGEVELTIDAHSIKL